LVSDIFDLLGELGFDQLGAWLNRQVIFHYSGKVILRKIATVKKNGHITDIKI